MLTAGFGGCAGALGCGGAAVGGRSDRRLYLGLARTGAALDLLDDDGLAAAVAEALAHDALLDAATLERQRLGRGYAQLFAGIFGRLGHSYPVSIRTVFIGRQLSAARHGSGFRPGSPVRNRSRRRKRAKNVSLAGPASRAACITFGRPNAKSNCAEVRNPTHGDRSGPWAAAQRGIELSDPVGRRLGGMNERDNFATSQRRLDLGEAGDHRGSGLAGDRQRIERRSFKQAARCGRRSHGAAGRPA